MDGSKNENISVSGSTFHYFKDRLNGGKVFANQEKSRYLRTANASEIADEITLTRNLYQRGFPVPEVVATGALESGTAYYIEKSIGDRVFGDVFREETKSWGYVSDASFDEFVDVIVKYCHAQFDHRNIVAASKNALAGITELENVMRNNPPSSSVAKVFAEALEKACERVMSLPWDFVQYDFNAFNVLQGGIIDFEFAGVGPIGYDVLTAVHFGRMWPKHRVAYVLTDDQIGGYLAAIDGVAIAKGCPAVSQHGDEFLVLKAIWSTAKEKASEANPQSNPDFWEWRVKMRDWCIRQYVNGEKIDSNRFEVAATAS